MRRDRLNAGRWNLSREKGLELPPRRPVQLRRPLAGEHGAIPLTRHASRDHRSLEIEVLGPKGLDDPAQQVVIRIRAGA